MTDEKAMSHHLVSVKDKAWFRIRVITSGHKLVHGRNDLTENKLCAARMSVAKNGGGEISILYNFWCKGAIVTLLVETLNDSLSEDRGSIKSTNVKILGDPRLLMVEKKSVFRLAYPLDRF